MGKLVQKMRGVRGALAGAVGTACAQSWLPLVGLVADGYRDGIDLGGFAGPSWFGTAAGLLAAYAGWFVLNGRLHARRAGVFGFARGGRERFAGLALACALMGCMTLAATRGAGSWVGPLRPFWQAAVFAGSALGSFGGAALTCMWAGRAGAPPGFSPAGREASDARCPTEDDAAGSGSAPAVVGGCAFALVFALMCEAMVLLGSGAWTPCVAGLLCAVSYALFSLDAPAAGRSCADGGPMPCGGDAHAARPSARPLLAGLMVGMTTSVMLGQFLACAHGVASPHTWLFSLLGAALAAGAQVAVRALRGAWDPFVACWAVAALFVVAFYPIDAGSDFSLKFAMSATTLALWSAAAVLPSTLAAFADQDGCRPAACQLSFAAGLVAAAALGGPLGYLVAGLSFEGGFVLASAVCSMVVGFVALTLVLNRPLLFCHDAGVGGAGCAGGVSVEPAVPDGARAVSVAAGGTGGLEDACARLADVCGLTPRERDVLAVLARGYDVARVCEDLGISEGTALTHKRHIYQKLDVHTRAELLDRVRAA